jgi:hypothetical protein
MDFLTKLRRKLKKYLPLKKTNGSLSKSIDDQSTFAKLQKLPKAYRLGSRRLGVEIGRENNS